MNKNATFGSRKWLSVILAIKNEVMMENMVELLQLNPSRALINTSDYATHEVDGDVGDNSTILDLRPISWDKPDNIFPNAGWFPQ